MTSVSASTLAAVLHKPASAPSATIEWRRQMRRALVPVLATAALFTGWSAGAPLSGAVVAPAEVKVELRRKTVQHAEGGIVREILVRDGQTVRAGDALLLVGGVRPQADLALLQDQQRAARLAAARAEAETRLGRHFELPADLASDPLAREPALRERGVLAANLQALDDQIALLQQQVEQAQSQASALEAQIRATSHSAALSKEELAMNEALVQQGFVSRTRLLGLQRVASDYASQVGEQHGDLAAVRQRAVELQARIAQAKRQHQSRAADELRDATARVRELAERMRPSQDEVERQTVRAPVDGTVMGLRVAAAGAVVAAREPLLEVVPARERLVIGARIAPRDIAYVHTGSAAEVRLFGAGAHSQPSLPARVVFVSPDRMLDPATGAAWFDVTVEIDSPAAALEPGAPAELYVTTAPRSLAEYLLQPLGLFVQRGMREP